MAGISIVFERNVIQSDSIRLGHVGKGGRQCNAESQTEIEITVEIGIWPYSLIAERCLFKGVGAIPKEYIPAVDQGIQGAMLSGVVAGYNVVDVKVELYDGSYHEVDSSEMAFKIAGSMAFKNAMKKADPVLLEPIMKVTVITPEEYLGDVIGDLNSRRGMIQSMEADNGVQRVIAHVPLSEMFGYATDMRSKTQGRGQYVMEPDTYAEVPKNIAEKIMSERAKKD